MRLFIAIVLGLMGGFMVGLIVSQLLGIVGLLVFDQIGGVKFFPIYTALMSAIIVPLIIMRRGQRAQ